MNLPALDSIPIDALSEAELAELHELLLHATPTLIPQPGPQTEAYYSEADILLYGGAAGGGKTFLAVMLALQEHYRTLYIRKEAAQLVAVKDELTQILGSRDGFNSQTGVWNIPNSNRQIRFGGVNNPGDETKYQGAPRDLLVIDEAANITEYVARFLMGWVRSTIPGQRTRTLLCSNPPTGGEGLWLLDFFAPWLDDNYPNPAEPGELRVFATIGGKDFEVPDKRPFIVGADGEWVYDYDPAQVEREGIEVIRPLSRTFIPARVTDNAYLRNTNYVAVLQGLPEPLRSQMLYGDFKAGMTDSEWQVIPSDWVRAAQARWTEDGHNNQPITSIGVDPARGGRDSTQICLRHGWWFSELIELVEDDTGPKVAHKVLKILGDNVMAPVHVDTIGIGSSVIDNLTAYIGNQAVPVVASEGTKDRDFTGNIEFRNVRAAMWWKFRDLLNPDTPHQLALPKDQKLLAELTTPTYTVSATGIQIQSKKEIIDKLGRSTDRADAVIMAALRTRIVIDHNMR